MNNEELKKKAEQENTHNNVNMNKRGVQNKKNNYNKENYLSPISFTGNICKIAKVNMNE